MGMKLECEIGDGSNPKALLQFLSVSRILRRMEALQTRSLKA